MLPDMNKGPNDFLTFKQFLGNLVLSGDAKTCPTVFPSRNPGMTRIRFGLLYSYNKPKIISGFLRSRRCGNPVESMTRMPAPAEMIKNQRSLL